MYSTVPRIGQSYKKRKDIVEKWMCLGLSCCMQSYLSALSLLIFPFIQTSLSLTDYWSSLFESQFYWNLMTSQGGEKGETKEGLDGCYGNTLVVLETMALFPFRGDIHAWYLPKKSEQSFRQFTINIGIVSRRNGCALLLGFSCHLYRALSSPFPQAYNCSRFQ